MLVLKDWATIIGCIFGTCQMSDICAHETISHVLYLYHFSGPPHYVVFQDSQLINIINRSKVAHCHMLHLSIYQLPVNHFI